MAPLTRSLYYDLPDLPNENLREESKEIQSSIYPIALTHPEIPRLVTYRSKSSSCSFCNNTSKRSCADCCGMVFYCNTDCQMAHWAKHKDMCQDLKDQKAKEAMEIRLRNEKSLNQFTEDLGKIFSSDFKSLDYKKDPKLSVKINDYASFGDIYMSESDKCWSSSFHPGIYNCTSVTIDQSLSPLTIYHHESVDPAKIMKQCILMSRTLFSSYLCNFMHIDTDEEYIPSDSESEAPDSENLESKSETPDSETSESESASDDVASERDLFFADFVERVFDDKPAMESDSENQNYNYLGSDSDDCSSLYESGVSDHENYFLIAESKQYIRDIQGEITAANIEYIEDGGVENSKSGSEVSSEGELYEDFKIYTEAKYDLSDTEDMEYLPEQSDSRGSSSSSEDEMKISDAESNAVIDDSNDDVQQVSGKKRKCHISENEDCQDIVNKPDILDGELYNDFRSKLIARDTSKFEDIGGSDDENKIKDMQLSIEEELYEEFKDEVYKTQREIQPQKRLSDNKDLVYFMNFQYRLYIQNALATGNIECGSEITGSFILKNGSESSGIAVEIKGQNWALHPFRDYMSGNVFALVISTDTWKYFTDNYYYIMARYPDQNWCTATETYLEMKDFSIHQYESNASFDCSIYDDLSEHSLDELPELSQDDRRLWTYSRTSGHSRKSGTCSSCRKTGSVYCCSIDYQDMCQYLKDQYFREVIGIRDMSLNQIINVLGEIISSDFKYLDYKNDPKFSIMIDDCATFGDFCGSERGNCWIGSFHSGIYKCTLVTLDDNYAPFTIYHHESVDPTKIIKQCILMSEDFFQPYRCHFMHIDSDEEYVPSYSELEAFDSKNSESESASVFNYNVSESNLMFADFVGKVFDGKPAMESDSENEEYDPSESYSDDCDLLDESDVSDHELHYLIAENKHYIRDLERERIAPAADIDTEDNKDENYSESDTYSEISSEGEFYEDFIIHIEPRCDLSDTEDSEYISEQSDSEASSSSSEDEIEILDYGSNVVVDDKNNDLNQVSEHQRKCHPSEVEDRQDTSNAADMESDNELSSVFRSTIIASNSSKIEDLYDSDKEFLLPVESHDESQVESQDKFQDESQASDKSGERDVSGNVIKDLQISKEEELYEKFKDEVCKTQRKIQAQKKLSDNIDLVYFMNSQYTSSIKYTLDNSKIENGSEISGSFILKNGSETSGIAVEIKGQYWRAHPFQDFTSGKVFALVISTDTWEHFSNDNHWYLRVLYPNLKWSSVLETNLQFNMKDFVC